MYLIIPKWLEKNIHLISIGQTGNQINITVEINEIEKTIGGKISETKSWLFFFF